MKDSKLKIGVGLLSLLLLTSLLIKLRNVPGGMILSGLFLGGMYIVGILIGCLILVALLKRVFKNYSFLTLYSITTAISFLAFHYLLYSPTLNIIVPRGYAGRVTFILSNVKNNILTVDTNGIGYLNQWTFNHSYSEPIVFDSDGEKINSRCVGFNPSTFWGYSKGCCIDGKQFQTKSFEVVPEKDKGVKQYYSGVDIEKFADRKLILLSKPDKYTAIPTETTIQLEPGEDTSNVRIQELAECFKLGKTFFKNHCSTCHVPPDEFAWDAYTFDHLFERLPVPPEDYFIKYIQDSKKLKKAGDSYANKLETTYSSDYEHLFKDTLSQREMKDLIVYIKVGVQLKNK